MRAGLFPGGKWGQDAGMRRGVFLLLVAVLGVGCATEPAAVRAARSNPDAIGAARVATDDFGRTVEVVAERLPTVSDAGEFARMTEAGSVACEAAAVAFRRVRKLEAVSPTEAEELRGVFRDFKGHGLLAKRTYPLAKQRAMEFLHDGRVLYAGQRAVYWAEEARTQYNAAQGKRYKVVETP